MQDEKIIKKNPNMVSRTIEDETILLPVYKTSDEINCIYTLNQTAARVWELFDGKKNLRKVKAAIFKEFDVTEKELDKELTKLLKELKDIKAVR